MKTTKEEKDAWIKKGSEIEADLLKLFGKDDPIVIADIGSCDGLSSIIYLNIFPNAEVHAFEPVYENFVEMNGNFFEYMKGKKVNTHFCALGEKNEDVEFFESYGDAPGMREGWETGNKSSSLLPPKRHLKDHQWCKFKSTRVHVRPLDSFDIERIDFAHIDVQGAELKVLKGGRNTFKTTTAIWLEVATVELYEGQPMKNEIKQYLDSIGFKVVKDTCGNLHAGDLLAVRK